MKRASFCRFGPTFQAQSKLSTCSSAGEPDQTDSHQVQPGGVHQVPGPHRRLHPVHRRRAAGVHRGVLPPPPLAPQAEREAHKPGNGHSQ